MFYRTVDVYHVHYKKEKESEWNEQVVETVNNTINHMVRYILPLYYIKSLF